MMSLVQEGKADESSESDHSVVDAYQFGDEFGGVYALQAGEDEPVWDEPMSPHSESFMKFTRPCIDNNGCCDVHDECVIDSDHEDLSGLMSLLKERQSHLYQ